jgi:Tfp pilus tip-associated adhesin PilY1
MGQGAGGTFYQTFDVTLDDIAQTAAPDSDSLSSVLSYFSSPSSVPLAWSFPRYADFDVNIGAWGDLAADAPQVSKTVGETWSDPAVGQIENASGRFVVLTGSGFLKHSVQQQANRNRVVAGTTFYILDAETGSVLDSRDVGSDNLGETIDNCAAAAVNDCRRLKNALHADPVATGPTDSRFVTKAYLGDLDGRIWRFDVGLDAAGAPKIKQLLKLYTVDNTIGPANEHPMFASMAAVNVGSTQQYLFVGTGSDLLPRNRINTQYALLVVLDQGTTGTRTGVIKLEATDGVGGEEVVSAFPAVAGDIVFFSTTTYKVDSCALPDANLYAFTFIGGPAYDTNNDGRVTTGGRSGPADSPRIQTVSGGRATSPFIVDQHLVFGAGSNIEMLGDPEDFNNGVGQAGVRILSWREVR